MGISSENQNQLRKYVRFVKMITISIKIAHAESPYKSHPLLDPAQSRLVL